jgi:subtilisin family serine protease
MAPILAGAGVERVRSLWAINALAVTAPRRVLDGLRGLAQVEAIYENDTVPLDKEFGQPVELAPGQLPWGVSKVKADKAWSVFGVDGAGVLVGHIDTGVDGRHPDLQEKLAAFRDFVDPANTQPVDGQGHGTHTAGTILGGSAGGARIGVAPGARLVCARVLTNRGATNESLLAAMQWMLDPDGNPATEDAPRIVSNSWSSDWVANPTFREMVKVWRAAGIYPCFAAGNNGPVAGTVGVPGGYPESVAIAALDAMDAAAVFSGRGPVKWDGQSLTKPDLSAPGVAIASARDGGGYLLLDGTIPQHFSDGFGPVGDGFTGCLEYEHTGERWYAGVRVETPGGRAVYTGFGPEGVKDPAARVALLGAVLRWLDGAPREVRHLMTFR